MSHGMAKHYIKLELAAKKEIPYMGKDDKK